MAFGLDDAIAAGLQIVNKLIPDPAKKAEAMLAVEQMRQNGEFKELEANLQLMQGQVEINKIEAASESKFQSWWRPFIGWTCGLGLAYQFLFRTIVPWFLQFLMWAIGKDISGFPKPVELDMSTLMPLLVALLGLGVYRTVEKVKGVN